MPRPASPGRPPILLGLATLLLLAGCDVAQFTANSTAGLFERAAPAIQAHWDYELVGRSNPGNILQLEGLVAVSPDNETLLLLLAKAYVAHAYGWIEDELEAAERAGKYEVAEALRDRARRMYRRARDLAFRVLRHRAEGFDEARRSVDTLRPWLDEAMDEDDAEVLFWAGNAWGSIIKVSIDDPNAVADLSLVKAVMGRAVALDETIENASGLVFLAAAACVSPAIGGDPEEGERLFERAFELTDREVFLVHVNYAMSCAVLNQDRDRYVEVLREVLSAGDPRPEARLVNRIAKRRARRYLAMTDELFL